MRLFLAIKPDSKTQEKLYKTIQNLPQNFNLKPVKSKDLHITLQFFENVEKGRINELISLINNNFTINKFKVKTQNSIFFPRFGDAKVIGINCFIPNKEFENINKLNKKFVQYKFTIEDRIFIPHITIFRVKNKIDKSKYLIKTNFEFEVKNVELIKSELTPNGPIYKTIKEFKLT